MSKIKTAGKLLAESHTGLAHTLERAIALKQFSAKFQTTLSAPLKHHCYIANIRDDTVVIAADSPAWLTQLRYQAPKILAYIKQEIGLEQIRKLHFKVILTNDIPDTQSMQPKMSQQAALVLRQTAESLGDPDLKAAFRRLAQQPKS
jgi:hypothetical protein